MSLKLKWMTLVLSGAMLLTACSSSPPPQSPAQPQSAAPAASAAQAQSRLDVVKQRGKLICGVNNALPGFGFVSSDGKYSGFDVDFCKAVAAALFDDPSKVEYRPLSAAQRLTAVQTGEVDVLFRNTTWTISRDTSVGMEFTVVNFYDGQGMMVRKDSGIKSLKDFTNRTVCVETGTTTELNLTDTMRKLGVAFKSATFADAKSAMAAYESGRCDGYTTDRSGLVSHQSATAKPADHVILAETISKEPLGPVVLNGDSKWSDVIKWVTFTLIEAEELGITSANVETVKNGTDPAIKRFLGVESKLGEGANLTNDFAYRVVKHVGNYAEVYNRNLGPNTPFNLPRGPNSLWKDGGLLYSPPFR